MLIAGLYQEKGKTVRALFDASVSCLLLLYGGGDTSIRKVAIGEVVALSQSRAWIAPEHFPAAIDYLKELRASISETASESEFRPLEI